MNAPSSQPLNSSAEVPSPNLSAFLAAFKRLLDYLTKDVANGGCGWPSSSIHLFGFGQGGAAAMEGAIAWTREQRGEAKICEVGSEMGSKIGSELGSVVDICGALASVSAQSWRLRESIASEHGATSIRPSQPLSRRLSCTFTAKA